LHYQKPVNSDSNYQWTQYPYEINEIIVKYLFVLTNLVMTLMSNWHIETCNLDFKITGELNSWESKYESPTSTE